ncbi:MAG: hypothetical protein AAF934_04165 [Bacteroidota bacterium]
MRTTLLLFSLLLSCSLKAQTNTEVYLFTLNKDNDTYSLTDKTNISNNPGYDNQPHFYNNDIILFSSTRKDQTDIARYHIKKQIKSWITDTPDGSEYSPTKIPGKKQLSSIRLDKDGTQLLYRYSFKNGTSKVLLKDLVVGYHTWFNKHIIVSFVLGKASTLVISDLKTKNNRTIQKNIGRSLHKIPNKPLISYISKASEVWEIRSLDPVSGTTQKIIHTLPETEDMCWLADGTILMGKGQSLYKYHPEKDDDWKRIKTFTDKKISTITRLATNAKNTRLALVAEASPE